MRGGQDGTEEQETPAPKPTPTRQDRRAFKYAPVKKKQKKYLKLV